MSIDILMPALSPTMEEGTLAKWLVKPGDTIAPGQVIAEIETDKATMEVEAVDEGVISEILVAEGAQSRHVRHDAGLVVGDAPPVEAPVPLGGFERRTGPRVGVAGRLDVVVRVQQDRGLPCGRGPVGDHGRLATRHRFDVDGACAGLPSPVGDGSHGHHAAPPAHTRRRDAQASKQRT